MTWRSDSAQLVSGKWVSSAYAGHGITGAAMRAATATGTSGPGILYPCWDAGDDAKEFRFRLDTPPSSGAFALYEDGSFEYPGAADGNYTASGHLFVDGTDLGAVVASLALGVGAAANITSALTMGAFTSAASIAAVVSMNASITMGAFTGAASISTAVSLAMSGVIDPFTTAAQIAITGEAIVGVHAYATAELFIAKYGFDETVQLLNDEERLLTKQLLQDALAGSWTGSPSTEERAAATRALARLRRDLATTSTYMDGYLRSVVTLPLPAGDANATTLETCCLALTRFELADDPDNSTEKMATVADTWRKWLKDIAAGKVQLVKADGTQPTPTRGVRGGQAATRYNWDRFGGGF